MVTDRPAVPAGRLTTPSPARLRSFVRRSTALADVAELPGIRLHQAADVTVLWHAVERELGIADPPLPYWGFPWSGGLALARHLVASPGLVAGRRVLDLGAGSGLCGIVAMRAGAASVLASDVDPIARAACDLNARANGVVVAVTARDLLDGPVPGVEVVLAGDVSYEPAMAARMHAWLRAAAATGRLVLVGDPGRAYLPADLVRLATYDVRTTREIEASSRTPSTVFRVRATPPGTG